MSVASVCSCGVDARSFDEYLVPEIADAGTATSSLDPPPADEALLDDWCSNPDAGGAMDPMRAVATITDAYLEAQRRLCPRLTEALSSAELGNFRTYVYEYTSVMVGCVNAVRPPPGGILAFGPANTPAVGLARPALSAEDARVLGEAYVAEFASALLLDEADRALVAAHVASTAQSVIDPSLSSISLCAASGDAGAE